MDQSRSGLPVLTLSRRFQPASDEASRPASGLALRGQRGHNADARGLLMIVPKTCYAKSGKLSIAYQVVGEGPFDVVFVPGFVSNLDIGWEMPVANLYRRIASFARLIIFDKRGTGLSDRDCGIPSLEERIDDVRSIMTAVGSDRGFDFWLLRRQRHGPYVCCHLSRSHAKPGPLWRTVQMPGMGYAAPS